MGTASYFPGDASRNSGDTTRRYRPFGRNAFPRLLFQNKKIYLRSQRNTGIGFIVGDNNIFLCLGEEIERERNMPLI